MTLSTTSSAGAADLLRPFLKEFLGGDPTITLRFWDGSSLGPPNSATSIVLKSPAAVRRLLYAPGELGLGRAYVAGDIDIEGDIFEALAMRDLLADPGTHLELDFGLRSWWELVRSARRLGALGRPLSPPPEEARLGGRRHSRRRDGHAIAHHYDVSNEFYEFVLGSSMTYSCAYFEFPDMSLADAQAAKHDLVCRKLGLEPGMRLLDVGCGWGGLVLHAVRHYGVDAVGITLSERQATYAAKAVAEAGLADRIEIRRQDYRDIDDGPYDAIASVGMFEHVGSKMTPTYFKALFELLATEGRLLNHAISQPTGDGGLAKDSFIARYVFPDGELQEVGGVVTSMQAAGFEARDVQSLREHYALTLRRWVANLQAHWDEAERLAGPARARVWRLYMAGSALGFEAGRINVHQVLGVKLGPLGASGMPMTRASYLA